MIESGKLGDISPRFKYDVAIFTMRKKSKGALPGEYQTDIDPSIVYTMLYLSGDTSKRSLV